MFPLRPTQARWFETYVPHEHTVRATEILARTGVVELEIDPRLADPLNTHKLRYFVKRGRDLIVRHLEDLPASRDRPSALLGNPVHVANQALHRLRVWSARLDYLKEQIAEKQAEREDLRLLDEALRALRRDGVDLEGLFRETRFLCKCLFACPKTCRLEESEAVAAQTTLVVRGPRHDFPFMMGMPDQRAVIRHLVVEKGCEQVGIPAWLSGAPDERIHRLHVHLTDIEREIARLERPLQALRADPSIAAARADIDTLAWYLDKAAGYLGGQELCRSDRLLVDRGSTQAAAASLSPRTMIAPSCNSVCLLKIVRNSSGDGSAFSCTPVSTYSWSPVSCSKTTKAPCRRCDRRSAASLKAMTTGLMSSRRKKRR